MRKLILADGTEYQNASCGCADNVLWCYLSPENTIGDLAQAFSDEEKTATIRFEAGEQQVSYTGFTELFTLIKRENEVAVALKRKIR